MAGVKGRSGPPSNMNAFKHGLAAIQKRREEGVPTEQEETVRRQILEGLIADKGGDEQISTATRSLVNSLTGNLQKFGLDRVPQVKTLEDLLQDDETSENPTQDVQERRTSRAEVLNVLFDCRLPRSESRSVGTPSADARPRDYYPFLF